MSQSLADRAAAIATKARANPQAERREAAADKRFAEQHIRREWWLVTKAGDTAATEVFMCPAQTLFEMRAIYPGAVLQ